MAAPPIPPIRLGLIGTGLAVEKLHWPALRGLADRYDVTAFTDSSTEQSGRFADYSGVGPARVAADRAALLTRDDVDAVLIPVPPEPNDMRLYGTEGVLAGSSSERRVTHSGSDATTHTTVFRGIDNGYRAELVSRAGNQAHNSPAQRVPGRRDGVAGRAQVRSSTRASRWPQPSSENLDPPTYAPHFRRGTPVDFADAVQFGLRPVGSVAQSVANAMVVQRALDSAERAAELALAPVPGAGPVPLLRPRGSTGLFDGLPGQRISSSASFVA